MSRLSSWAIRHPVPVVVLFLLLALAGWSSFTRLKVNALPDVSFPVVSVTVAQIGAAPVALELDVTRKVEDALAGLAGIKHLHSIVSDGVSSTTAEFHLGTDPDRATNDVTQAIAQIRADLPQDVEEPVVTRFEIEGEPILHYVARAPQLSPAALSWFVDDTVARELLFVPGVQEVKRLGGVDREIRIELDPDRLMALRLTVDQVNDQLRQLNIDLPGGRGEIGGRRQTIRTLGGAASVEALAATRIAFADGRQARLSDIATVVDGIAEPESLALFDGEPVVGFSIARGKGSSDITVAAGVAERIEALKVRYPAIGLELVSSSVTFTQGGYDVAIRTLVEGALLTVVVVFLFLRDWRPTLIAAIAMPLSLLPTFMVMEVLGFSLNTISLLALTLVIGLLVDDAIVEVENIDRHIQMGKRPYIAALDGADAIGLAVVATTLTIVAVFAPTSFVQGVIGQYFAEFGLTVAIAALFSLLVARLMSPLMAAYLLKPARHAAGGDGPLTRFYLGLLGWALDHRWTALFLTLAIFAGSLMLVPLLPRGFLAADDGDISVLRVELPPGARLGEAERIARAITASLAGRDEVAHILAIAEDTRKLEAIVVLKPHAERAISRKLFELTSRAELGRIPDIRFSYLSDGEREVSIPLVGDDPEALARAARALEEAMRGLSDIGPDIGPNIGNVYSTEPVLAPELQIVPRLDEAARLGVSVATIATVARIGTIGETDSNSAKYNLADRQIPIRVTMPQAARADIETLRQLRVGRQGGGSVPLSSVADIRFGNSEAVIERLDRSRRIAVEADLGIEPIGTALAAIEALPAFGALPEGVRHVVYGDAEYIEELFANFALAMLIGVGLMLAVLIVLFGNFLQPLTILMALPLSIAGAIGGLFLYRAAFDLSAILGILMLMGIVTKNSILLVDYALHHGARLDGRRPGDRRPGDRRPGDRRPGDRREVLIDAARTRARPIIMTTAAMIAGMLPAALAPSADAAFRAPMAVTIIGGLLTSTLLSLVVVPVVFTFMDDLSSALARRLRRLSSVTEADISLGASRAAETGSQR